MSGGEHGRYRRDCVWELCLRVMKALYTRDGRILPILPYTLDLS